MENIGHEDKLFRDALMEATPPDINESWADMEHILDQTTSGSVVTDGSVTRKLLLQKIWLSSIFLVITSTALIGSVISNGKKYDGNVLNSSGSDRIAHVHDLSGQKQTKQTVISKPHTVAIDRAPMRSTASFVSGGEEITGTAQPEPASTELILVPFKTYTGLYAIDEVYEDAAGVKGDENEIDPYPWAPISYRSAGRIGLAFGVNGGGGYQLSKTLSMSQAGFYINLGRSPIHTFQAEVLYNQLPIKAMQTVEVHRLPLGHTQIDSVSVRKLNYVSVPLLIKYNLVNNWTIAFGPQVSFLTGLTGDKKTTSTIAGEETRESTYENLESKYGMKPVQAGLVFDFGFTMKKIECRARYQYGITNISVDNNYLKTVYRNHSNFTFGVAYTLQ